MIEVSGLASRIVAAAEGAVRLFVAVAGPPGSGKSTLVETLKRAIDAETGGGQCIVFPMDGFHYDNAVLDDKGLRIRKGAPETFDVAGYAAALARIRRGQETVAVPVFDRDLDVARAGGRLIEPRHRIVLTEGNYLLLDEAPWRALSEAFDLTVFLDVPEAVLERRLVARWLEHGHDLPAAEQRARTNDLVNARFVKAKSRQPDVTLQDTSATAPQSA